MLSEPYAASFYFSGNSPIVISAYDQTEKKPMSKGVTETNTFHYAFIVDILVAKTVDKNMTPAPATASMFLGRAECRFAVHDDKLSFSWMQ